MAENIHKLTKNGETIIPATTTNAVVHPELQTSLTNIINEYNLSTLFPNSGVDGGDTYTLEGAISILNSKLIDSEKKVGLKLSFKDNKRKSIRVMKYLGGDFSSIVSWEETENPNIIDGGRADTIYGGVNIINCGGADSYI